MSSRESAALPAAPAEFCSGGCASGALIRDPPRPPLPSPFFAGRSIRVGPHEEPLTRARARQADPGWKADYTATRPKVERKIGHLMRRRHGGRRARVRGRLKSAADFALLAAGVNLARLAVLGLAHQGGTWIATTG